MLERWFFSAPNFGANERNDAVSHRHNFSSGRPAGGTIVKAILRLTTHGKTGAKADPRRTSKSKSQQRLLRPDGSELQVEFYGPEDGIPIVLTHGWGLDSREWNYLKRDLSKDFRLIVWDEPGLGSSTRPKTRNYSLENLAADLEAVLALTGDKPAILGGHSIGGMITLTFCRLFPAALGSRVMGLVLTHTTPTNPVRTTSGAAFYTAIEKPVLVPLMYLTIALSPLVWLMNWLSFLNGSAHLSTKHSSFGGTESWEQLDFITKFQPQASPAVMARGMLGMMHYDAREIHGNIDLDSGRRWRPGFHHETGSERVHQFRHPTGAVDHTGSRKHLGLIEHYTRYSEAIREFAYAVQARFRSGAV